MPTQPAFRFAAPAIAGEQVDVLIHWLDGKGWMKGRTLCRDLGWDERTLRAVASASGGRVLGSNRGYCLTLQASAEDVNEVTGRLLSQAGQMKARVADIEKVFHARRATAA